MKYKREFKSGKLPCNSVVLGMREPGSKVWRIYERDVWESELDVCSAIQIKVIRLLQKLYDNTPKRCRK